MKTFPEDSTRAPRLSNRYPRFVFDSSGLGPLAVACLVASMMVASVGCETRNIGKDRSNTGESAQASAPDTRELVFSDQFERDQLGDDWKRGEGEGGQGEWTIEDGWLEGKDIHNTPLWLRHKLPEQVRIEFDARARSARGDLKVEVFGDGVEHESGYILIFGGWENRLDVIARLDEHGDDRKERPSRKVQRGKTYRMAVERTENTIEWFVDGESFMTYEDPNPLRGSGHRYFAFSNWEAPVQFDNVEVYDLGGK